MHTTRLIATWTLVAATLSASVFASAAQAQDKPSDPGFWTTPALPGFGKMHAMPSAAYQPDKKATYKIVFALTRGPKTPDQINPALERVARAVNLYASAGVPLSHLKFVAVAYGDATSIALDDEHYQQKFGVANPNLAEIAALRRVGVDIAVCAQAVAEHDYEYSWIDHSVTLSLSGITTVTVLEHAGYVLMPL
jgi:intracellular sulfur oxidation DsrE/DsrF family protein